MSDLCRQGNECFATGKYSDAIKKYNQALKKDPNNLTLLCNRGWTNFKLGLFRACLKDAHQVLSQDDHNAIANLLQIEALIGLGKSRNAEDMAREWLKKSDEVQDVEIYQRIYAIANALPSPTININGGDQKSSSTNSHHMTNLGGSTEVKPKHISSQLEADVDLYKRHAFPNDEVSTKSSRISLSNKVQKEKPTITHEQLLQSLGASKVDFRNTPVEKLTIIGFYKVNTGMLKEAIDHFTLMIKYHPTVVQAYLGRGTAYALENDLDNAILDFSKAIAIEPRNHDAWKRRGQARAARGYIEEALKDLSEACMLAPTDAESFHQRGILYYNVKYYTKAIENFTRAVECDPNDKISYNFLGLCLTAIGKCMEAVKAFEKATKIDPLFREAWCNMAQAYKDWGDFENAEKKFKVALEEITDSRPYEHGFYLRSLSRYCAGELQGALADAITGCQLVPNDKNMIHMKALSLHALGSFHDAVQAYNVLVKMAPTFFGWHQREIAIHVHSLLDIPLSRINLDNEFDKPFKEAWSKRLDPAILKKKTNYQEKYFQDKILDVSADPVLTEEGQSILRFSAPFGSRLQLKTPGFLPNMRQHRMCGLAVLEMAQFARHYWEELERGNTIVMDGANSSYLYGKSHKVYYRDFFDIAVKWRQISEPNDPVWWIDLLPREAYEEGFGLQTPMWSGECAVPRYYPYYEKGLAATKELVLDQWALTDDVRDRVKASKTCAELHNAMGKDFWVVTYCYSTSHPGEVLEGTRLTIVKSRPGEGHEFTIRTPATPNRWVEFDKELHFMWNEVTKEARQVLFHNKKEHDQLTNLILRFYFYWVNFGPLTRGTAAIGLIAMMALFLACDIEVLDIAQTGKQLDFESIIGGDPELFAREVCQWLVPLCRETHIVKEAPDVKTVIHTPRKMIETLNAK